jgi:glycosyltransferase involved in cell wall biosynthesis
MSKDTPSISVVITAYNSAAFLNDAVDSVLRQTLQPSEIVVIDDGSIDDTAMIAQSYANVGLRHIRQDNQGEGAARNRGILETSGEWIAFLDADDIWLDDKIQRQVEFAQSHPGTDMVSGHKIWWDVDENSRQLVKYGQVPAGNLYRELTVHNLVGGPSLMLIRRVMFEKAGVFRTDLRFGADWEMWLRIAKHTTIGFVDSPLIIYRWHKSNVSTKYMNQRVKIVEDISLDAIRSYRSPTTQIALYLRVKSRSQVDLTYESMRANSGWIRNLGHALCAFMIYPFENPGKKLRLILNSVLGKQIYNALKSKFLPTEEVEEWSLG